jgi:hypothetical protein
MDTLANTSMTPSSSSPSPAETAQPFTPGVYFDLDHASYLRDPALGSSAVKALSYNPALYWYSSHLNPFYRASEPSRAQRLGTAFHTMVLDGPEVFKLRYAPEPGPDFMRLSDEIAAWIKEKGGKPPRSKSALIEMALGIDPAVKIYDAAIAAAKANGMEVLSEEDWARIIQATQAIVANPALRPAISGGHREVSVFWEEEVDGVLVRKKARFDYLKPRAVVDLKSTRPTFGRSFEEECLRAIANWRYDIQAGHYLEGRRAFAEHWKAGRVVLCDLGKLDDRFIAWGDLVASAENYAFVFVFWANDGAPLTWGGSFSPGNPALERSSRDIETAIDAYVRCSKTFAPGEPWLEYDSLGEIWMESLPRWFVAQ